MERAFESLQQAGECLLYAAGMEPGTERAEFIRLAGEWLNWASDCGEMVCEYTADDQRHSHHIN